MTETKRFHCKECDYYWEITSKSFIPRYCPLCDSHSIHRAIGDRRYSRKARQKVRWSYSGTIKR
jgi:Zn finger protein HypA/HybF involved in hydrogenase expression